MKTVDNPNEDEGVADRSLEFGFSTSSLLLSSNDNDHPDDWVKLSSLARQREKLMAIHKEFFIATTTTTTSESPSILLFHPPPQRRSARNSAHPPKKYYIPDDTTDEEDLENLLLKRPSDRIPNRSPRKKQADATTASNDIKQTTTSRSPSKNRHHAESPLRHSPRIRSITKDVETKSAPVAAVQKPEPVLDAWGLFGKHIRPTLEQEHPHVSHVALRAMIRQRWNQLSMSEKLPYEQEAQQLQAQYQQQWKLYQKQQQVESNRSKRKRTTQTTTTAETSSFSSSLVGTKRVPTKRSKSVHSVPKRREKTTTTTTTNGTALTTITTTVENDKNAPSSLAESSKGRRRQRRARSEPPPTTRTNHNQISNHRMEHVVVQRHYAMEHVQDSMLSLWETKSLEEETTAKEKDKNSATCTTMESKVVSSQQQQHHLRTKGTISDRVRKQQQMGRAVRVPNKNQNNKRTGNKRRRSLEQKQNPSSTPPPIDSRFTTTTVSSHHKQDQIDVPKGITSSSRKSSFKPLTRERPSSQSSSLEQSNCDTHRAKSSILEQDKRTDQINPRPNKDAKQEKVYNSQRDKMPLYLHDDHSLVVATDQQVAVHAKPMAVPSKTIHAQLSAQRKSSNRAAYSPTPQKNNQYSKSISPAGILKRKIVTTNSEQESDALVFSNIKSSVQSSPKNDKRPNTVVKDTVLPDEKKIMDRSSDLQGRAGQKSNHVGPDGTGSSAETTTEKENDAALIPFKYKKAIYALNVSKEPTVSKCHSPKRSNVSKDNMGTDSSHVGDVSQVPKRLVPDHSHSPGRSSASLSIPNSQKNGESRNETRTKGSRTSSSTHSSLSVVSGSTLAPKVVYVSPEPRYIPCGHCAGCLTIRNCRRCLQCMLIAEGPPKLGTGVEHNLVCIQRICTEPVLNPKYVEILPAVSVSHALGTSMSQVGSIVNTLTMDANALPIHTPHGVNASERISSDAHSVLESLCDDDDDDDNMDAASDLESPTPNDSKPPSHAPISGADLAQQLRLADQEQWDYRFLH